jgi:hypothetical protein
VRSKGGGRGKGGEMTQILYALMNKIKIKKKKDSWSFCFYFFIPSKSFTAVRVIFLK